jgi:hypothetical protein
VAVDEQETDRGDVAIDWEALLDGAFAAPAFVERLLEIQELEFVDPGVRKELNALIEDRVDPDDGSAEEEVAKAGIESGMTPAEALGGAEAVGTGGPASVSSVKQGFGHLVIV